MVAFADYQQHLLAAYSNLPKGYYTSLFIIRKTESETIFRTEGSGEELVKETVSAGILNTAAMRRVVISKRKQTAVERRMGREFLNKHELLKKNKEGKICMLNTNAPCEQCMDCFLYGFAAGGGGAQKSRVFTDDAYSLGSVAQIAARRTFNATYDNGTMRNPETGEASRSINRDEYVLPQTHFLDIETLKDVTLPELHYVIGNIMRSERYGAISSRIGKVQNKIVGVVFSDCELFSNLELTQHVYDQLLPSDKTELPFPLEDAKVEQAVTVSIDRLITNVFSQKPVILMGETLQKELQGVAALYYEQQEFVTVLSTQTANYPRQR
ncbi:MAG: type I-D CRISPR-associated protein Cas7/Csc2 [Ktedonobacteraceae bacterium]